MVIKIPIQKEDQIFKAILNIVNFNLKLTEKEINIICDMLKKDITVINKDTRKILTTPKDKYNFNNYIVRLKEKGVLLDQNGVTRLNPNIVELSKHKSVGFEFIVNG
jgi:hypothetical protein